MSKYKVYFGVDSKANANSKNSEIIDLVDDWDYTEKEAEEIINDKDKLFKVYETWLWDNIECYYYPVEEEEEE